MHATQTLMTWRWSSWVFCASEASLILGKVDISQWSVVHKQKYLCLSTFEDEMDPAWTSWSYFLPFTVFQEFVRFTNKDIEQIIKKEMSGDVKNAFYAIGNNDLPFLLHFTFESHCWQHLICDFLLSLCSSQCKEPTFLFCRPLVQSHEGIHS